MSDHDQREADRAAELIASALANVREALRDLDALRTIGSIADADARAHGIALTCLENAIHWLNGAPARTPGLDRRKALSRLLERDDLTRAQLLGATIELFKD